MIYNDPDQTDDVLPAPLLAALANSVSRTSPPPEGVERVHMRLMDKVRTDSPQGRMAQVMADAFITLRGSTQSGEGWVELLPKAHAKLLFTDGEAESYMIRLEPGAWAPAHDHPADEECLVLEGSLWQGDVFLKAGDFHVARPGMRHGELRTDTGALVFIRYAKPLAQYLQM
jgi:quercetin dioxygenase-like cupin family protein